MNNKVLTQEEKIRRAQEIYYRRKNIDGNKEGYATLNIGEKRDFTLFRKMFFQIIICILIYFVFYIIQNSNYIFSEQIIEKTKGVLSYDINFEELKNNFSEYMKSLKFAENQNNEQNVLNEEIEIEVNNIVEEQVNEEIQNQEAPVLGITEEALYKEEASSISQVETDSEYIKNNFSLIKPLQRCNYF